MAGAHFSIGGAHCPFDPLSGAPKIVRTWRGQTSLTIRHPWLVAFAFGLLCGVGLATIQERAWSLPIWVTPDG
jgi:hypothetical protein